MVPQTFASGIEARLTTAVTSLRPLLAFPCSLSCSSPSLTPASWAHLPAKLPALRSLSQALLLGEHKLRHWLNWFTSLPLEGRCCYLFMPVCIPSLQMGNVRLGVVKEPS